MITNVLMPKLGLVMKKGRIIKWYKQAGDYVKEGEKLFQISTEKVTIDVESKGNGYLRAIYALPGAIVPVSGIIGILGDKDEPLPDMKSPVYEMDNEGIGDYSAPNNAGTGLKPAPADVYKENNIKASPAAKRLAKDKGIDIARVRGTGPGGRITESDVINFKPVETAGINAEDSGAPAADARSTPYAKKLAQEYGVNIQRVSQAAGDRKIYAHDIINLARSSGSPASGGGADKGEAAGVNEQSVLLPLTDIRKAVAERMSYSVHTVAPVTLGMEVIAAELLKLKIAMAVSYPSDKITINDILVKLAAMALKKHPLANASLEDNGIRVYNIINVGIGVAIEGGLIVPAITDADKKSIVSISRESRDLIERAKTGRLTYEELSRGTFTITNLGSFGIDMFTPIINPPQSTTLGVGRIIKKPVVIDDRVEAAPAMVLSLTFDHRIIDGAPAAQFLQTIKLYVENPYLVLGV